MHRKFASALLPLSLAAALPVLAQDAPPKMSPEEAAMMAAFQKAGAPGAAHAAYNQRHRRSSHLMITRFRIAFIVAVAALSLATLHARQQPAAAPEVFCNTMQAGALCPTATVSILKLSGANVQKWLDAVGKYNAAVENATRQLKADTKGVLTPAQMSELDRWMDKGINPEVNKILASRNATR